MLQPKQKPFEIRFDRIVLAYKTVRANKGSYGVDDVSLEAYEQNLQSNLYKLWNRMSSGSYFPQAVRRVEIDKKGGGKRPLGIPTIADRVAQALVKRELEILVEPIFHEDSFGYRHRRSAIDAVGRARQRCWKFDWVLDIDIQSFFEDIPQLYIERWLKMSVQQSEGSFQQKDKGTPQGAVISPVLANLFLHYCFDEWMRRNISHCPFERYADDCVIHCQTERQAQWVRGQLGKRFTQCGLTLHPVKTKIVDCRTNAGSRCSKHQEFDFLGYTFRKRKAITKDGQYFTSYLPAVSKKSIRSIRNQVKECRHISTASGTLRLIANELNPKIRGWFNSYGRFYPSELKLKLQCINRALTLWAKRKFKRFRKNSWAALGWIKSIAKFNPTLFEHWRLGAPVTVRQ